MKRYLQFNKDFDLFYYQRRYKIEGIEQKYLVYWTTNLEISLALS